VEVPPPASSPASGRFRSLLIRLRLVHPFPSLLDGAVVGVVALVGGGGPRAALTLGASMTLLQFAIGTVNDLVDAPRDAGVRADKAIPAGLVGAGTARIVAAVSAAGGLVLAAASGPWLVLLALVVLGIGAAYDLWARGTTWSWVPLAVGIPILPVFGWFGATSQLPGIFIILVPAAANAGAALAIANAVVDIERDEAAGSGSIAVALGPGRSSALVLALHLVVAVLAVATASELGAPTGWVTAIVLSAVVPIGGAMVGIGTALRAGTSGRELAWEIQAVGTGLLAVAWIGALSASTGISTPA
jgi:4-hydroxybenzoate polyprenyltransferase